MLFLELQRHNWYVNQKPQYLDTRSDRTDMVVGLHCLYLEYQVKLCGPEELEFTRVSVFSVNNANEKVYIGLWYLLITL